ncbi:MAG: class I SAM-dependent methyltransferase, partial [Alphaproteobacteria bacterium]|nr:class I SAM-dependent methyltransferase [Alphaproteobacteria bacterium]
RSAVTLKAKHLRQFDREFGRLSAADPAMSVLEIGCGAGLFLRYLENRGYRRIVGVDVDDRLKSVLGDLTRTELLFGDIRALAETALKNETFDRIALFDVVEHIELSTLIPLMRTLRKLLTPEGRLVIRTPNVSSPWGVKMFFDSFDHVTPLTPARMEELAAMTGYTVLGRYEQLPTKPGKRLAQGAVHALLSWALAYRPDIWSANFIAVLSARNEVPA